MQEEHLAIASVPIQKFGAVYEDCEALHIGTVFKDLDKPFFASGTFQEKTQTIAKSAEQEKREELLNRILEVSFVLDDLTLYLDTHETDQEALKLYRKKGEERNRLKQEFAEQFYPLTRDCLRYCKEETAFCWQDGPMPWEGACV